jgi:hypothetical protein
MILLSIVPSCSSPSSTGRIFSLATYSAPTIYTLYTYGFNATDSSATLTFAMEGDSGPAHDYWLLDNVSVNHTNVNTNILINGGFETGDFTGWTRYCATDANCGGSGTNYGQLTTSTCYSGTYCYQDKCSQGDFDYLTQSFSTVSGDYYLISFYLKVFANGGPYVAYVILT